MNDNVWMKLSESVWMIMCEWKCVNESVCIESKRIKVNKKVCEWKRVNLSVWMKVYKWKCVNESVWMKVCECGCVNKKV